MARVVLHSQRSEPRSIRLWCVLLITSVIMLLYFGFSIGLTFYQRQYLQKFRIPFTVVCCHLIIKFILATVIRLLWSFIMSKRCVHIPFSENVAKFAATGFAGGLDIAFSNWALELITISLYTMTKSTSIIFFLIFGLLLGLERKSWGVFVIVFMIAGGLTMFTYKATQFDLEGFLLVLIASFACGLRWTLAQFVMHKTNLGIRSPLDMMYFTQPWMFIIVFPFAAVLEGSKIVSVWANSELLKDTASFVVGGAMVAFSLEVTEFLVVDRTSSLTLSVASIFKEIVTLILAVEWNGDEVTSFNALGLALCMLGILAHVFHKADIMRRTYPRELVRDEAAALFLPFHVDSSEDNYELDDDEESSSEVLFSVVQNRE